MPALQPKTLVTEAGARILQTVTENNIFSPSDIRPSHSKTVENLIIKEHANSNTHEKCHITMIL